MQVLNHTFTCFYPGQDIEVKLVDNNLLHTCSLICPACDDVCNQEFETQCKGGKMPPVAHFYPEHQLT